MGEEGRGEQGRRGTREEGTGEEGDKRGGGQERRGDKPHKDGGTQDKGGEARRHGVGAMTCCYKRPAVVVYNEATDSGVQAQRLFSIFFLHNLDSKTGPVTGFATHC